MTHHTPEGLPPLPDAFDARDFYELMQAYRCANIADQSSVISAFEAVKTYAREALRAQAAGVVPLAEVTRVLNALLKAEALPEASLELLRGLIAPAAHVPADVAPSPRLDWAIRVLREVCDGGRENLGDNYPILLQVLGGVKAEVEVQAYRAQHRTPEPAQAVDADWLHLKAYGYAPGGYMSTCLSCSTSHPFLDKRACRCRPCAEKLYAAPTVAARQPQAQHGGGEVDDADISAAALRETGFDGFGLQAMNIGDIQRIVRTALATKEQRS